MTDIFEPVQNLEYDPAPMSELIRTRSYARRVEGEERLETWDETVDRCLYSSHLGLKFLGKFTEEETRLVDQMMRERKAFGSARWLWVGGSKWVEKPENYPGGFNCSAWEIVDWDSFGIMMDLAMQGCGTGANVELRCIEQLPVINTKLEVKIVGEPGQREAHKRSEETLVWFLKGSAWILVGDSRQGWVNAYQKLLELSASDKDELKVFVDVSGVRPAGERLLGFGGIANPIALPGMFLKCADVLNQAVGRKLNSLEVCLLIGEAAAAVVAGNVRRCLPEDALVHTANGLVPIKAVNVGDLVQTPAGFKRVTNKFYQGLQDVYEIRTNSMPFRSTLSHRHAVLASAKGDFRWVSCNDLIEGDRLLHTKDVLPGTKTDLPPDFTQLRPKNSTTAKNLTIPSLTPLIAWLIGFTHGNGHVGLGRNKYGKPYGYVNWTTNATYSEEFLTRLKEKIKNGIAEFGLDIEVTPIKGENTIRFNCCSIRLAEYFHKFIKQAGRSLEVPDFILKGDASIRSAYLAGLVDSDGAIYNRPPVLVTNISKTFIYQVGSVLSSLGIAGRYAMSLPSNPNWNIRHSVNIPALKPLYNSLIAPYSLKGPIKIGLKMYGYTIPATLMREEYTYTQMRGMKLSASRQHDSNYEKYSQESDVEIDIPVTVESVEFFETMETYDIEVEEVNCFYCNGYLTHNSAGLRVGSSDDPDFTTSKDNLWQQDESGNWVIDHKRDALRSANHTRAFHKKPTYEECLEAVTKQYHSGEGAIQWSGEAVARANADLLNSPEKKALFLSLYQESIEAAKAYLKSLSNGSDLDEKVLENRIRRYSANPCFTGDMKLLTVTGYKSFAELENTEPKIINKNGNISNSKVWCSGEKEVVRLRLSSKKILKCTPDHVWYTTEGDCDAKHLKGKRLLPYLNVPNHKQEYVIDGFVQGDGNLCRLKSTNHLGVEINIGTKDQEFLSLLEDCGYMYEWNSQSTVYVQGLKDKLISDGFSSAPLPDRSLPTTYKDWSVDKKAAFLNGLFTANGSVLKNEGRVTLKTTSRELVTQVINSLKREFGINAYFTTNKPKKVKFRNGEYTCRESYDVCIQQYESRLLFFNLINFSLSYKTEKLQSLLIRQAPRITSVKSIGFEKVYDFSEPATNWGVVEGYIAHNCHEIIGSDFMCNLAEVHLNQLDPYNFQEQKDAFRASSLQASALLQRDFAHPRINYARTIDPIVGVSATGFFTFFTKLFGVDYVRWWEAGRNPNWDDLSPDGDSLLVRASKLIGFDYDCAGKLYKRIEAEYCKRWRDVVECTVYEYCDRHGLRRPNRCTTVKPSGSMSMLTGTDCNGLHPPFAAYFIRRMTFGKNDPVALAAIDYGYNVVPSQSDKDETGKLLNDPFDDRCTEWLVEVPVKNQIVNAFPELENIKFREFSALAHFDFYMVVQQNYIGHTGSVTISLSEDEIKPLAKRIYEAIRDDEGYVGMALLAKFDAPFPRLPYEAISREKYNELMKGVSQRRKSSDFNKLLSKHLKNKTESGPQDSACEGLICESRK
ncbi:Homing endonuclease [Leptolyngbyaceae cyanobacterium JSC-12]|nr:Homing endonuclease [Leptolyngbyaceae cyanobacterium JSC-12]